MTSTYRLTSSTLSEEGGGGEDEKDAVKFPFERSHLRYYYYPGTTRFIGKNTIPRAVDMRGVGVSKMKKELKATYSFLKFDLLDSHKGLFSSKFKLVQDIGTLGLPSDTAYDKTNEAAGKDEAHKEDFYATMNIVRDQEYVLVDLVENIKEIGSEIRKQKVTWPNNNPSVFYAALVEETVLSSKRQNQTLLKAFNSKPQQIFLLKDSSLEALNNKSAYIFFQVMTEELPEDTSNKKKSQLRRAAQSMPQKRQSVKKYIFHDEYYKSMGFYEYLDFTSQKWIEGYGSCETRVYKKGDITIILYSNSILNIDGRPRRFCSGIDTSKNTKIAFNKTGPKFYDFHGKPSDKASLFTMFDLADGDYVINDMKIHKIGATGTSIEWTGIDYSDFFSSNL